MVYSQDYFLFVGTYTGSGSKGIYVYRFNAASGEAKLVSHTEKVENPSYLALSPNGKTVYACNETASASGGKVSAFRFNKSDGSLRLLNQQATGGDHPAYVAVDPKNKWVVAGNYSGGSIAVFSTSKNGSIQPFSQLIKHVGRGPDSSRQRSAHVHATVFSPKGDYLLSPDLGIDRVMVYPFKKGALKPLQETNLLFANTSPGGGPRHLDFHPNGRWAYLMEEMSGSVTVFDYSKGKLSEKQRIFSHSDTAKGPFGSADIHVSPDGKFLYASNRAGEHNLAIFNIGEKDGKLTTVGYQSTLGKTPRNFVIEPSGNYLLVANQDSNNIVVFKRDKQTGSLTQAGTVLSVPKPVCLKLLKAD